MDTVLERREMMLDAVATGLDNLEGQEDFAEEFAMLAMEDEEERVDEIHQQRNSSCDNRFGTVSCNAWFCIQEQRCSIAP